RAVVEDGDPESAGIASAIERELELARRADLVFAVSPGELDAMTSRGVEQARRLGHAVTAGETTTPFAKRSGLLFVGNLDEDGSPNVDSLAWFSRQVLPHLPASVVLEVVGSCLSVQARGLESERIRLHGRVEDLEAFYSRARLFVAPTRFSAGLPIKVLDAAARGVPVVATQLLERQLGWESGVELLSAPRTDAREFAALVTDVYRDEALWQRLRQAARDRVLRDCSPRRFANDLLSALAAIDRPAPRPPTSESAAS
ncbi:MAG: glycosyltransferase family 4 protein, partial [Thermoanaerobaculia bacterium]|nr:glycosyltransferase family 4 protein [Thermoanaerobaculia bacterium]